MGTAQLEKKAQEDNPKRHCFCFSCSLRLGHNPKWGGQSPCPGMESGLSGAVREQRQSSGAHSGTLAMRVKSDWKPSDLVSTLWAQCYGRTPGEHWQILYLAFASRRAGQDPWPLQLHSGKGSPTALGGVRHRLFRSLHPRD